MIHNTTSTISLCLTLPRWLFNFLPQVSFCILQSVARLCYACELQLRPGLDGSIAAAGLASAVNIRWPCQSNLNAWYGRDLTSGLSNDFLNSRNAATTAGRRFDLDDFSAIQQYFGGGHVPFEGLECQQVLASVTG